MARMNFLLPFLLMILAISIQTHAIDYTVNLGTNSLGRIQFERQIGVEYSQKILANATTFIWKIFQQDSAKDRKNVEEVTMFIDDIEVVNDTIDNEIHVSARYIESYSGHDIKREITGILFHETTHIWQWDGNGQAPKGLLEGIADYVRLKAGYAPSHWVKLGQGDRWDQAYDITARFLDYCNSLKDGFVAKLNKKMRNGYSDQLFVELLGKTVDQLWKDYKAQFSFMSITA